MEKDKKKIKCPFCFYEWETKSDMKYVSCPSCLNKVEVIKYVKTN